jgi:hypothetical protein
MIVSVQWADVGTDLVFDSIDAEFLTTQTDFASDNPLYRYYAHAVIIDGIDANTGWVMIRDPQEAVSYGVTVSYFRRFFSGFTIALK